MRHKNSSIKLNEYKNIIINLEKKQTNKKNQKIKSSRTRSKQEWMKSKYHSLSFSFSFSLSLCLTCLSLCLSACLPVCLPAQVDLSYRGMKRKGVSPRMAVGTKGSAIRTHQQQTDRERDGDRDRDRTTERQTGQKRKRRRRGQLSTSDLDPSSLSRLDLGFRSTTESEFNISRFQV